MIRRQLRKRLPNRRDSHQALTLPSHTARADGANVAAHAWVLVERSGDHLQRRPDILQPPGLSRRPGPREKQLGPRAYQALRRVRRATRRSTVLLAHA